MTKTAGRSGLLRGLAVGTVALASLFGLTGIATAAQGATTPNAGSPLDKAQITAAAAANDYVECEAGGPTQRDRDLANSVNGHLTGAMSGGISPEQASCARAILDDTAAYGWADHAAVIEICAAITEASLLNLTYGDSTSVGLFQMLDDKGTVAQRTDVTYETHWFLNTLNSVYPNNSWLSAAVGDADQAVERSAYPGRYQPNAADAQTIVNALRAQGSGGNAFPLFHEIRDDNGNWSGFQPLSGAYGAPTFAASRVAVGGFADGSLQTIAIGIDGNLYHNIRVQKGSWQGWNPVAGVGSALNFQAGSVAVTAINDPADTAHNGDLDIAAVGNDGLLYFNIRYQNGSWQGWDPVEGAYGAPTFAAKGIAMAGMPDDTMQIIAIGDDGNLYHNIRNDTSGGWQGWIPMAGAGGAPNFQASTVAMTGLDDGSAQVIAVGNTGYIYHNVRDNNGNWQGWNPTAGAGGAPESQATSIAIGAVNDPGNANDGSVQVIAVGITGLLYHNIRYNTTSAWQGWNVMAGFGGAAQMASSTVAMAGNPGTADMQVIATRRPVNA